MIVKKKVDFNKMKRRVTETEKSVWLLASGLIAGIRKRTLRGIDMYGMKFKPYTTSYREIKRVAGKSTTPNLSFHEHMLKAMSYTKERGKVKLYFNMAKEKLKASGNHNVHKRYFFGLSKEQRKVAASELARIFRRT